MLSRNMGSALCIKNVRFPIFLQSVFISGNLNGAVEIYHSTVTFSGTTTLTHNRLKVFCIINSNVSFTGSFYFERNNGSLELRHSNVIFCGTTTLAHNRGKVFHVTNSNVSFTGSLYFERNNADSTCTFAAVEGSKVIFAEHTSFSNNYLWQSSGSVCIYSGSNVTFSTGRTEFIKNQGEVGDAIHAHSSYLNFHGNVIISENVAYRGGGLSLYGGAIMIIHASTSQETQP